MTCVDGVSFPTFSTNIQKRVKKFDTEPSAAQTSSLNRLSQNWSPTLEECYLTAFRHIKHLFPQKNLGGHTEAGIELDILKSIYLPWFERMWSSSHRALIVAKLEERIHKEASFQGLGVFRSESDCSSCADRATESENSVLRSGHSCAPIASTVSDFSVEFLQGGFQALRMVSGIEVRHSPLRIYVRALLK